MNPDTRTSAGPVYLRRVAGRANTVVAPLTVPQADLDALTASMETLRSGWTNTFLCA